MPHYYSKENNQTKSAEKLIFIKIKDRSFRFITDHGVFSKQGLDFGSRLLIESVLDISAKKMLDLGCGYGPIGTTYKSFNKDSNVDMVDVNERALILTKKNSDQNQVQTNIFSSDGFSQIKDKYDLILTNPPIRAGKAVVYRFFTDSYLHLEANGQFIFVINKKHGAASALKKCKEIFAQVETINKKSGYYVIKCRK
ncbi:MAG: methyltransferase [Candidatus Izemoplasmatales bacterium]